jgi:hypothetical protein
MSDSSSGSSSDDENWAALQSVAVSYEQVVTQHEHIAEKVNHKNFCKFRVSLNPHFEKG